MIRNYFKIAWRNLVRNKVYALINIAGLALGISACLIIYLVASFELSYENFHPDKQRIYRIVCDFTSPVFGRAYAGSVPDPAPAAIREELSGFESVVHFHSYDASVTVPQATAPAKKFDPARQREQRTDIVIAEPQYFNIFRYRWLAGDPSTALSEPFKVVLTESKAYQYLGKLPLSDIIGKTLIYNDSLRLTISGIVKDLPQNTDFIFRDFISFATVYHSFLRNDFGLDQWGNFNRASQAFVKLPPGADPAKINAQFPAFIKKHRIVNESDRADFKLQPLADIHFNNDYGDMFTRKAHLPTLYGLMGIALFILVIAAINFINLSTAQSIERAKETGIRKLLGSNRRHLILQFLSETFILTLLAVILSLFLASPLLALFQSFIPEGVSPRIFTGSTLLFLLLVATLTTLLAGLYPAVVLSAGLPLLNLKGSSMQTGNRRGYLRKGLIVFQFIVSLVFITGTLVISNQIRFMLHKDMGFVKDAIINIPTSRDYPYQKKEALAAAIRELPGVDRVSVSNATPAAKQHWNTSLKYQGKQEITVPCQLEWIDENFVPLYQMKIIAGRNVLPSDTMREFLINASCAKALGFQHPEDAIGRFVQGGVSEGPHNQPYPIVGVVADFHSQSLHEPIKPVFFAVSKKIAASINVKLDTRGKQVSHFTTVLANIEKAWKAAYPNEKFTYAFFDDTIARFYEKEQQTAKLVNTAMGIAIFISCMGLFGLAAFTAKRRTREIGIRKVLGASVANITTMLSKDFVILVAISIVVSAPLAWYFMHKWLENFAYRVSISWWVFVLAGLLAMLIALVTVSFQAVKAAVVNPVKSLRTD
jgi:predicted permease